MKLSRMNGIQDPWLLCGNLKAFSNCRKGILKLLKNREDLTSEELQALEEFVAVTGKLSK